MFKNIKHDDEGSFGSVSALSMSTLSTVISRRAYAKGIQKPTTVDTNSEEINRVYTKQRPQLNHGVRIFWRRMTDNRNKRIFMYLLASGIIFIDHKIVNRIQILHADSSFENSLDDGSPLSTFGQSLQQFFNTLFTSKGQYGYTPINTNDLIHTSNADAKFDALEPPSGYPFHRWSDTKQFFSISGYPLNVEKFVSILHKMGNGETIETTLEGGLKAEKTYHDFIRISGNANPYLIRNGRVLRPFGNYRRWKVYKWHSHGHHIDWVTLLESAVAMAKRLEKVNSRMKLITEGEFPIIFDEFDYPWCADDLVPIFRLGMILSEEVCTHSWPSLSLNYILPQRSQWLKDKPRDWDSQHAQFNIQYPWESKLPFAVWRGRYTGYRDVYEQGILPREQLVIMASNNQDIMDVRPVSWQYLPNDETGETLAQRNSDEIPFRDFMKFRAILDIDSNGASTRFGPLLCMNSVVLKVQPQFGSYWNHEVKPGVHYIPVKSDLSNLKKQVAFAVHNRNQMKVRQIIENANQWCKQKMTWEQHARDFLWTLLDYAELLENAPNFSEKWTNDRSAYRLPKLEMARFDGDLMV